MLHKKKIKKGQSTLEYVILVTAIVVIFLVFFQQGGLFHQTYNSTLHMTANTMLKMANRISNSQN